MRYGWSVLCGALAFLLFAWVAVHFGNRDGDPEPEPCNLPMRYC